MCAIAGMEGLCQGSRRANGYISVACQEYVL